MNQRPLSPHLQVYRLPITGLMSILHRITGVLASIGALSLLSVPVAVAAGPVDYDTVHTFLSSITGRVLLWIWMLALSFHLCHGARHLLWDLGFGFQREQLTRHAAFELIAFAILAVLLGFVQFAVH